MQRKWIVLLIVLGLNGLAFGQGVRILEIMGGYLNPKDATPGMIIGGTYGVSIDERVDLSLGLSYYHKKYSKTSAVADTDYVSGIHETTVLKELEYSTSLLPVSGNVNIRIPFQPPVYWLVGASVTYNFLFNTEKNYEQGLSEKRTYKGWGWMLRAGVEYMIGSRSSIVLEAIYNIGKVHRNADTTVQGLPVWDEVNLTGLGFRTGLRLEFF